MPVFTAVYALLLALFLYSHRTALGELAETKDAKEALLSEYRRLKRYAAAEEELARQQERTRIARDMHDSLGHKLTALLMQLEVLRLESADGTRDRADKLKALARDCLAETRRSVQALSTEETDGLRALMELVRKLEAESFIRVQFSLGEGVLSASLDTERSIAVYRAVQEALTNAMKHGASRLVEVGFSAPGGRAFRFEVSNALAHDAAAVTEGFGLKAMRERLAALGGSLEIAANGREYRMTGTIPLETKLQRDFDRSDFDAAAE